MIHGLDTGFFVALEYKQHAEHAAARVKLARLLAVGDKIAIAPQVVAEFMHVITDSRRFAFPLDMDEARRLAEQWWGAAEVVQVLPDDQAIRQFFIWVKQYSLGRKRMLDTMLAATFREAGIQSLLTTNAADFSVFGCFTCVTPSTTP